MTDRRPTIAWALLAVLACFTAGCATEESKRQENLLEIYKNTAESYYQLKDNDRAIGQSIKALEIDRDDLKTQLILAWSLTRRGTTEDLVHAEMVFRSIADEEDFRVSLGLGTTLERLGVANSEAADAVASGRRVTEARDPKKRAAELKQRSVDLWTEASTWYEKTLTMQKSNLDALNGLQRVDALLGQPESSLARSRQMITALVADRAFWEAQLKRTRIEDGEEREIRKMIRQFVDLEVATRMHAAQVLHGLGENEESLAQLDAAIVLNPDRADVHGMRAVVQRDLGRYDNAIADAQRFIALSPQLSDGPDVQKAFDLIEACGAQKALSQP